MRGPGKGYEHKSHLSLWPPFLLLDSWEGLQPKASRSSKALGFISLRPEGIQCVQEYYKHLPVSLTRTATHPHEASRDLKLNPRM